jgi:queuosine precursor transporter
VIYIGMYLLAIVAANLLAAHFGPSITVLNALLFIGLDLTARDSLHEAWNGRGLWWKMGFLIATGSALSFALNRDAGPIALASFVAFASAGMIDALVYHRLLHLPRWLRINGSNVPSAFTDSLVFPTLAFGGFLWPIVLGQFAAKVLGGFVWSLAFRAFDKRQAAFVN